MDRMPVGRRLALSGSNTGTVVFSLWLLVRYIRYLDRRLSGGRDPTKFADRTCRGPQAVRRRRARRDREGVVLSRRKPALRRPRRRFGEGPGPAMLTVPAGALTTTDTPARSLLLRNGNPQSYRCVHAACGLRA